ncbi:MAG: YheU family protein [Bdellovibrionales bacterium]|nr:YheU family protein [Bdellovibrionales bacterium]
MKNLSSDHAEFVVVPTNQLSEPALEGLIEEFILREGTDYGIREFSLEEKKQHIRKQLHSGWVQVVYDLKSETASLIKKEDLSKETHL